MWWLLIDLENICLSLFYLIILVLLEVVLMWIVLVGVVLVWFCLDNSSLLLFWVCADFFTIYDDDM